MKTYSFRLLNVFAESTFGGNPLCVFEHAEGLRDEQMQALALQFNLSETVFILPSRQASARMRIFATGYEMPFAGHPTLGAAQVVRDLLNAGDRLSLECKAGVVQVSGDKDHWTFTAPSHGAPRTMAPALPAAEIAAMLGLTGDDLLTDPIWVDTGTDQLLVALKSHDAVKRAQPDSTRLAQWPQSRIGRKTAYVFAFENEAPEPGQEIKVVSRYFFAKQGGGIAEDPGTGSACANLGGWWIAAERGLPACFSISQGEQVQRPSRLSLDLTADKQIRVGGRVIEIGRGTITL
ncbi:PhzF family phenazine biosynthesis protein [Undibacterium sp.]|uniref:PhzF family phenazine biosynthesis protein n=1 Tax=Undibacterium sp. TaxID=1914977 RepID=UPI002B6D0101|nr:PhzF family phenazine biosynthesis protein [Undibacterium sp.]HTD07117.1 PhzF family phenazine biosynthesis protein [Undibacterium sp.]